MNTTRHFFKPEAAQIEKAKALYAAGKLSVKEIMKLTGFKSYSTFYKYIIKGAVAPHRARRPRKITQVQIEQAKALYAAGELSVEEIIKLTCFRNYSTFRNYIVKNEARTRRRMKPEAAQIEKAKALYAAGKLSVKEIMKLTGFKNYGTFRKYIVKSEAIHTRKVVLKPTQIEKARALYAAGELAVKEIMKLTGFKNYGTFRKYIVKEAPHHSTGRPKEVTQAQIEKAKALYTADELSVKEIMKLTGFKNYGTFHHYVVKGAMPHSIGRPKEVTQAQIEKARALYAAGELSIRKIMKIVGFKSPNTFYQYVL